LAAFSWGSSTVLGKHALRHLSFPVVTALRLAVTAIVALAVLLSISEPAYILQITSRQWFAILIIVFTSGSVALFIYYYGLKHVPASHSTIYELFWPLSAVALDWFIRGRLMSTAQALGAVVLLTAIILLTREQRMGKND
jgi:drug/metabolite transporter (DMT)-like permease